MRHNHRRVLLALGWYDHRLHRGIEKFAQEHLWHLSANLTRERIIPWGWEGDGILAWLGANDELARFVVRAEKPTVDFSFRRPHLPFPRVLEDHAHAGQLAAEHLIARGFRKFSFYSESDNWTCEERGRGFRDALRRARYECEWLRWHDAAEYRDDRDQWRRKRSWLARQLKKMPKPFAIMAATDNDALDIQECCDDAKLSVPDQIAIVGAGNNLMAQDAMRTPISSVDTNLELLGYTGAALLEDLMNGKSAPPKITRVPAAGIIARKSSDLLAIKHKGVANCLRFIWENAGQNIGVKDLVSVAAMSRRGLHQAFQDHVGRTPGEELHRMRIERAKRLLLDSDHKLETLATMCGYQSANSFGVAFKQATGMSPRQYRERHA